MKRICLFIFLLIIIIPSLLLAVPQTSILVRDNNGNYHILKGDENGLYVVIPNLNLADTSIIVVNLPDSYPIPSTQLSTIANQSTLSNIYDSIVILVENSGTDSIVVSRIDDVSNFPTAVTLIDSSVQIVGDTTVQLDTNIAYLNSDIVYVDSNILYINDRTLTISDTNVALDSNIVYLLSNIVNLDTNIVYLNVSEIGLDTSIVYLSNSSVSLDSNIVYLSDRSVNLDTSIVYLSDNNVILSDSNVQLDTNIVYLNNNNVYIADTNVKLVDTAVYLPNNEIKIISIKSFSNSIFVETGSFNSTSFVGFDFGDTFQKITIATDTDIIWNTTGSGAGSQVFANSIDVENIEIKTIYIKLKNPGIGYITIRGVKE